VSVVEFIAEVDNGKIEIPKEYRDELDSKVRVVLYSNKKPANSIEDLFADFDGEYELVEIDWGKPEGKEIW
jgi:antitoxin component of MazEF toxin-antitoxin module